MEKPQLKTKTYLDFNEAISYIENKYNIRTRGYTPQIPLSDKALDIHIKKHGGQKEKPYLDFWHWICDVHEIHNGCDLFLDLKYSIDHDSEYWTPLWVKEILKMLMDEFGPKVEFYVFW